MNTPLQKRYHDSNRQTSKIFVNKEKKLLSNIHLSYPRNFSSYSFHSPTLYFSLTDTPRHFHKPQYLHQTCHEFFFAVANVWKASLCRNHLSQNTYWLVKLTSATSINEEGVEGNGLGALL